MSRNKAAAAPAPTVLDYEKMTLEYWMRVVPDLGEITIIVRRGGKRVREVVLEPVQSQISRLSASSGRPCPSPGV